MTEPDQSHRSAELISYLASFLTEHKRDLLPRLILNRTRHVTVVLEDIHKSHNASACLRSCDCFGIQDVHIIENRNKYTVEDPIALGAAQWLTAKQYNEPGGKNTEACLSSLKSAGYTIVMTSPHQADCELESYDVSKKTALIFGNERDGASPMAREMSDYVMRVPMFGFTESINLSVAVAVVLHHLVWRTRDLDLPWQLSTEERDELLLGWVRAATGKRLEFLEQRFFEEDWQSADQLNQLNAWPDWPHVASTVPLERRSRSWNIESSEEPST